jgi:G3E family GTPase
MLLFPSSDIGMFGRRQRHARGHRIPVTIAKNFGTPQAHDTAVVADAFGADDVMPLGNDCACCTVRVQLQAALRRLLAERAQGRHFTRVVIESDEDLGAILRTFATDRALGAEFYVEEFPAEAIGARTAGVRRFVLTEDTPLPWEAFARFMTTLMDLRGADLLHVRGLINVAECRGPVVVAFLQHLAHPPVELAAWRDDDRRSRLAFIARNLEEKTVRTLFDAVRKAA